MMGQVSNKSKLQESVTSPLRQGKSEDRRPAVSTGKTVPPREGPPASLKLSTGETQTIDSAEDQLAAPRPKPRPLPLKRVQESGQPLPGFEEPVSPGLPEADSGLAELHSPLKRPPKKKTLIRPKKVTQPPRTFESPEE